MTGTHRALVVSHVDRIRELVRLAQHLDLPSAQEQQLRRILHALALNAEILKAALGPADVCTPARYDGHG